MVRDIGAIAEGLDRLLRRRGGCLTSVTLTRTLTIRTGWRRPPSAPAEPGSPRRIRPERDRGDVTFSGHSRRTGQKISFVVVRPDIGDYREYPRTPGIGDPDIYDARPERCLVDFDTFGLPASRPQ
jgi:hypothetical protein